MEAVTKYRFETKEEDELPFAKASIVNVIEMGEDENWFRAEQGNREGWIPKQYIEMKPHDWFYGKIKRREAEEILMRQRKDGVFLIRESESSPGEFSLSVRFNSQVQHFKVLKDPQRRYYLWNTQKFDSLTQLVEFHRTRSVSRSQEICLRSMSEEGEGEVIGAYDFKAAEEGEVSFRRGDTITVLDKSDPHWWKGMVNGQVGMFPANYVQEKPKR